MKPSTVPKNQHLHFGPFNASLSKLAIREERKACAGLARRAQSAERQLI